MYVAFISTIMRTQSKRNISVNDKIPIENVFVLSDMPLFCNMTGTYIMVSFLLDF